MSEFKDRLIIEKDQLEEKAEKLQDFVNSEKFEAVAPIQQSLLRVQLTIMISYIEVLEQRLDNL